MSVNRINGAGARINRERALSFQYNGRNYSGFEGDTLASALLAAGEKVLSRSWKYHRPRGIVTSGIEDAPTMQMLRRHAGTGRQSLAQRTEPTAEH